MASNPTVLSITPKKNRGVYGITILRNEVFIARYEYPIIEVYDTSRLSQTREIKVPDLNSPVSLASCQHHNCLYISDDASQTIHRINLSDTLITKWSANGKPRGLSVTKSKNMLVTFPSTKLIGEYSTHGDVIREILLDESIDFPLHAIELSSGQLVVSHVGTKEHRVCIVDTSGRLIHSYSKSPGSSNTLLNGPLCLSVDRHDLIFVADCGNNRIQVLSPKLTYLCEVSLPGYEVYNPNRLELDEKSGRLYIGEGFDGQDGARVLVHVSSLAWE